MAYRVEYAPRFLREFNRALDYYLYELQNSVAADKMLKQFDKEVDFVSRLPYAGTPDWSRDRKPYYYVDVGHYFAFYQVVGKRVIFRRFLHARSDMENRL